MIQLEQNGVSLDADRASGIVVKRLDTGSPAVLDKYFDAAAADAAHITDAAADFLSG